MTSTRRPRSRQSFDAGFGGATTTPGRSRLRPGPRGVERRHRRAPALIAHCRSTADVVAAVNLTRTGRRSARGPGRRAQRRRFSAPATTAWSST